MLDLEIQLTESRHIRILPYRKPTSQWQPLSHESQHPWSVHTTSPKSLMKRYALLSSDARALRNVEHTFRSLFAARCPEHPVLHDSVTHFAPKRICRKIRWLILPYRAEWASARFNAALACMNQRLCEYCMRKSLPFVQYRIGWRLGSPHLWRVVKSYNWSTVTRSEERTVGG